MPDPSLRERVVAFLDRPVPPELNYAPGSIAELVLATYAETGTIEDAELHGLLEICVSEADGVVSPEDPPDVQAYLRESAELLRAISASIDS